MKVPPLALFMAALLAALFSGSLDRASSSEGKLKRVILVFSAGVMIISLSTLMLQLF